MTNGFRIYDDMNIKREVDAERLGWPGPGEASEDSGLGCNREYGDLRQLSWKEARRVFLAESDALLRLERASDMEAELQVLENEEYENDSDAGLYGLDIGVASTVVALSAARCIPFSSCNGGVFGDRHYEDYPLVAFYSRRQHVTYLLACAEAAEVGIDQNDGALVVYSGDISRMRKFAQELYEKRGLLQRGVGTRKKTPRLVPQAKQLKILGLE